MSLLKINVFFIFLLSMSSAYSVDSRAKESRSPAHAEAGHCTNQDTKRRPITDKTALKEKYNSILFFVKNKESLPENVQLIVDTDETIKTSPGVKVVFLRNDSVPVYVSLLERIEAEIYNKDVYEIIYCVEHTKLLTNAFGRTLRYECYGKLRDNSAVCTVINDTEMNCNGVTYKRQ